MLSVADKIEGPIRIYVGKSPLLKTELLMRGIIEQEQKRKLNMLTVVGFGCPSKSPLAYRAKMDTSLSSLSLSLS